jgi:hypothetical protein
MKNFSVRRSTSGDQVALERLAALDSAQPPHGPALIAETDSRILAALPLGCSSHCSSCAVRRSTARRPTRLAAAGCAPSCAAACRTRARKRPRPPQGASNLPS